MTIPVWLLDVDGVINKIGKKPDPSIWPKDQWSAGTARCADEDWPILWAQPVVEFIRLIHESGRAEVRWHTTWQHEATAIEDLCGLPKLAVAEAPEFDNQAQYAARAILNLLPRWWKLPAALRVVEVVQRPLIWTDDDINPELRDPRRYALDTMGGTLPVLPISPNRYTGLTPKHLRQITAWLDGLESGQ